MKQYPSFLITPILLIYRPNLILRNTFFGLLPNVINAI